VGSDDIFKKRKKAAEERKRELRTPKPNSFLIVSEGAKTEPLYFDGLAKHIEEIFGSGVDVKKPIIETCGEGKCTVSLVHAAGKIVNQAHIMYENVWIVFDKDDFDDFDEAIDLAKKLGFKTAWSNQSFEYWLYLHFDYMVSALHRNDVVKKLDEKFKDLGVRENGYEKNLPNIFELVTTYGSLKTAISNAKRVEKTYREGTAPSRCWPCTKVHDLILELKPFLDDLM